MYFSQAVSALHFWLKTHLWPRSVEPLQEAGLKYVKKSRHYLKHIFSRLKPRWIYFFHTAIYPIETSGE